MPKKSILVVDDDEKIIRMLSFLFLSKGFHVVGAKDGIEALKSLEASIPSVVILDLAMPLMDGFLLYSKIKAQDRFKDIPVIVLSALPSTDTMYKLDLPDSRYYLHKPFRTAEIMALVTEVTDDAFQKSSSDFDFRADAKGCIESD